MAIEDALRRLILPHRFVMSFGLNVRSEREILHQDIFMPTSHLYLSLVKPPALILDVTGRCQLHVDSLSQFAHALQTVRVTVVLSQVLIETMEQKGKWRPLPSGAVALYSVCDNWPLADQN